MTNVSILGQIRGNIRQYFSGAGTEIQPMLSDGGAQIMVQGLPERAELVKLGASWGASIPTGSAFAPVAAWPTTLAALIMYNGEGAGGPTYVIERVWFSMITGGMTGPAVILGQVVPSTTVLGATGTGVADNSAILKQQLSGRVANYGGNAKFAVNSTTLGVASKWFPLGPSTSLVASNAGAVSVGLTAEALVQGRILIPPGAALLLNAAAGQAIGTAIMGLEWHEVYLNLG